MAGVCFAGVIAGMWSESALVPAIIALAATFALYRPALGLIVMTFMIPFDLSLEVGPSRLPLPAVLLVTLALVVMLRRLLLDRGMVTWSPVDRLVLLFAGATGLSLLGMGGHLQDQLTGLATAAAGFLLFFLVGQSLATRNDVWLVMAAAIVTGLLQASSTTIAVLTGAQPVTEWNRATGPELDPNHFAGFLVLIIPLLVGLGIAFRPRWTTMVTLLATLPLFVALFATLSRSGWLGLVASAIVLAAVLPERRWRLAAVAAALSLLLFLPAVAAPIGERLGPHALGPWEMLSSRWIVWTASIGMAAHHAIFGVGVGNFGNYFPAYVGYPGHLAHAHNLFLNIAAERGLLGLATFVVVLAGLLRALIMARRAASLLDRAAAAGLMAAFSGYLVHSLFDVSYYDFKVLLLFWLLAGVSAALPRLMMRPGREAADDRVVPAGAWS